MKSAIGSAHQPKADIGPFQTARLNRYDALVLSRRLQWNAGGTVPIKPRGMHQRNYDRLLGVLAYHEALRKQGEATAENTDQINIVLTFGGNAEIGSSLWWVVSSRPSDRLTDKGMNQKRSRSCHREALLSEDGWEYRAKPSYTFFSPHVSGTQRLRTGNVLICEGQWGRLSETDCQVTINPPSEDNRRHCLGIVPSGWLGIRSQVLHWRPSSQSDRI